MSMASSERIPLLAASTSGTGWATAPLPTTGYAAVTRNGIETISEGDYVLTMPEKMRRHRIDAEMPHTQHPCGAGKRELAPLRFPDEVDLDILARSAALRLYGTRRCRRRRHWRLRALQAHALDTLLQPLPVVANFLLPLLARRQQLGQAGAAGSGDLHLPSAARGGRTAQRVRHPDIRHALTNNILALTWERTSHQK